MSSHYPIGVPLRNRHALELDHDTDKARTSKRGRLKTPP
ncbi:hypothetical protein P3T25_007155 [Paraburkholderia sp. GAS32]